jgi:16S rRNA (uracil1498-N3)-methyltransferase
MSLFYSQNIIEGHIILDEDECRHLKVLRRAQGDAIEVTDGKGTLYQTEIIEFGKRATLRIVSTSQKDSFVQKIHLYVSPTKNLDRMEWMVEKCTEMGISSITFIKCRYSERKHLKIERLERKALSAMKQSKQVHLPKIFELLDFKSAIESVNTDDTKLIAHCEDMNGEKTDPRLLENDLHIFIGPEGDFSVDEIKLAKSNGFKELSLGATTLRTETAAMAATAMFRLL